MFEITEDLKTELGTDNKFYRSIHIENEAVVVEAFSSDIGDDETSVADFGNFLCQAHGLVGK